MANLAAPALRNELSGAELVKKDIKAGTSASTARRTSNTTAKAALLAMMEIHSSLSQLDQECTQPIKDTLSLPDWTISTTASATPEVEEVCTDLIAPATRASSGMQGAESITPQAAELDLSFDSHELGFWGDVGQKTSHLWKGKGDSPPLYGISEENIMPWEL